MHYEYTYQDRIYIEKDDGNLILFWKNQERSESWGHDNDPDSEYNKMMDLTREFDFTDYDNPELPNFIHYVYKIKYKVTKTGRTKISEKIESICSLVEEFYNT